MTALRTMFGCDLRTLALVRICLGAVIIADLVNRALSMTAHYTDDGVMPRSALLETLNVTGASIHMVSGAWWVQAVLFVVAGLCAFSLMIGYRARLAAILTWVLLISLDARNTYVSQGGDMLLRMLVFWIIFLPSSARFAVDAALDRQQSKNNDYFSMATVGLLVQAASVYFFTALLKTSPVWMPDGTAVHYALFNDTLVTAFAVWFRQFGPLLHFLTYYVWILELVTPLLLFSPFFHTRVRLMGLFLLITMHIGFLINMNIGLFPFISITSLLAFTPGSVWDWIEQRINTKERTGLQIFYDEDCVFCHKICLIFRSFLLPRQVPIVPAQSDPAIHEQMLAHNSWVVLDHEGNSYVRWHAVALVFRRSPIFAPLGWFIGLPQLAGLGDRIYGWIAQRRGASWTPILLPYRNPNYDLSLVANASLAILLAIILWLNLTTIKAFPYSRPELVKQIASTLRLNQKWSMFAPAPTKGTSWYIAKGTLVNGTTVDIFLDREDEPTWKKEDYLPINNENYRWRKFLARLPVPKGIELRPFYTDYLCRDWNRSHDSSLASVDLHFFMQWNTADDSAPSDAEHHLLWVGKCSDDPRDQVQALRDGEIKTSSTLPTELGSRKLG